MSVYGYFTSNDLSKFGNFLFYALIGSKNVNKDIPVAGV